MFSFAKISISKILASNTKWLENQQTSINSAALIIALANAFSVISGFIRTRVVLSYFTEDIVTAWQLAFQIPDFLFQLLVFGALSAAFIPIFLSVRKNFDEEKAFKMSSIVLNILLIAFTSLSVLVFIFAEPLTTMRVGDKISPEQIAIIVKLTKIMLLAQVFFTVSNVLTGILQSYRRFIIPSMAPILYNVGIMLGVIFFSESMGIYSAGFGVVIGSFLHMIVQVPLALKLGFRVHFSIDIREEGVLKLFLLSPARLLTIAVTQIQTLALGYFATSIGQFSFLYITYATYLSTFPIRMFGVPLSQAALPFLSQHNKEEETERFKALITQSLNQISFLALPTSILLLVLRVPIVRLVFGTDNFSWQSTLITGRVLAILAISISAQAMVQLLIRGFHALKDTRTPLIISIVFTLIYLGSSLFVVKATNTGVLGLAIVNSMSFIIEMILFLTILNQKIPNLVSKEMIVPQLKMILASFFMAVFIYLPFRIFDELVFDTSRTVDLIGLTITTGTIGMLVYIYFAAILEIKELELVNKALSTFTEKWKNSLSKTQEFFMGSSVDNENL